MPATSTFILLPRLATKGVTGMKTVLAFVADGITALSPSEDGR